jgi:hypothetical protein
MLKKMSAVVAMIGLLVAGVTPAAAVSNTDSQHRSWDYTVSEGGTSSTSKTWSFDVSPGATEVRASAQFKFGANRVAANVGAEIDASIILRKPDGSIFENGDTNPYFMHSNTYPHAPYTIANLSGEITSFLLYNTSRAGVLASSIPAGRWTAEVTLTLNGNPITLDTSGGDADNTYLFSKQAGVKGTNLIQTMPTSVSDFRYFSATCVNKDLVAPNDELRFTATLDNNGTTIVDKAYVFQYYGVSDDSYIQRDMSSSTGSWEDVINWTDNLETKGMYVKAEKYTTVNSPTSGSLDLSIYNTTTSTEVSTSCATAAPSVPTISITSLYGGEILIPEMPGVPRYEFQIVDVADESDVVASSGFTARYAEAVDGYFTGYFSARNGSFEAGRTYKARLRSVNPVASSAWSSWSEASGLVGPSAPNAPVLAITSPTQATVTIDKVDGVPNSNYYSAKIYEINDRSNPVAEAGQYNCGSSGVDPNKIFCDIYGDGFTAPSRFVAVAIVKNSSDIWSSPSADSNIVDGIAAGTTLTSTPSGLTTDGKARLVGDNVLGTLLNGNGLKVSTAPDGNGALYIANRVNSTTIEISKTKSSTGELESTFGSNGKVSITVDANSTSSSPGRINWFGSAGSQKWISSLPGGMGYFVTEGDAASSTGTPVSVDSETFCQTEMASQAAGSMDLKVFSAPTPRPVAVLSCSIYSGMVPTRNLVLVKINADGSLTKLVNMTPAEANDYYVEPPMGPGNYDPLALQFSINKAASGSEPALALVVVNGIRAASQDGPSTNTAHSRVLWRIPADLSAPSQQALTYTTNTDLAFAMDQKEPNLRLQPFNNGSKLYAMVLKGSSSCNWSVNPPVCTSPSSFKLHQAAVASGNFDTTAAAKTLIISGNFRSLGFQQIATSSETTVQTLDAGEICRQSAPGGPVTCSYSITPTILNLADGRFTNGEPVTYTTAGSPVSATWTNSSGNLQWLFTKVAATGHSLIEWKPAVVSTTPTPPASVPTVTSIDVLSSVDAGGATVTVTGTNLSATLKVVFGSYQIAPTSKSATKVTFKVPSKALAGGSTVPVSILYGTGAGTLLNTNRTFSYVGAAKITPTLTISSGTDTYETGATPREVFGMAMVSGQPAPLPVVITTKTPSICTYATVANGPGILTFVGSGVCTLEAAAVGTGGYNSVKTTKSIYVVPTYNSSNVLSSTDGAQATITLSGVGLTSVSKVLVGTLEISGASLKANATGTQLAVKLPLAGANAGQTVDVKLVYGPSSAPVTTAAVDEFTFVGAAKLAQTIELSVGDDTYESVDDADRMVVTASVSGGESTGLTVSVVSKTPLICTVTQGLLAFVGAGTCTVEASQAGNAGYLAAQKVTRSIYVVPVYNASSALYSTDAGKPTIVLTGTGLTSVTKIQLVNSNDSNELIEVTGANLIPNKTGTSLTVKVPVAGVLADDVADLKLVYGPSATVVDTADNFEFVGPAKLSQVLNFAPATSVTYGDAMVTLTPTATIKDSNPAVELDVAVTIKTTTPKVCSVVGYQLRYLTSGTCSLVASQAGNAGLNKAADVKVNIIVAKKAQTITVADSTLEVTDASSVDAGATLSHGELVLDYTTNNDSVCTVDATGVISGLMPTTESATCVITVSQAGDLRYLAAESKTISVTITSGAEPVDILPEEGDGEETPAASIGSGGLKVFTETNDSSVQLAWDRASGRLIPRATGVYIGYIQATLTFTKNGDDYSCTNVFGTTKKYAVSKLTSRNAKTVAAQKKKAMSKKVFVDTAFCTDTTKLTVTSTNMTKAGFPKIKPGADLPAEKANEKAAYAALKGFTGTVTIKIQRYRAWPTTGLNYTGYTGAGKRIPATTRVTTVNLG